MVAFQRHHYLMILIGICPQQINLIMRMNILDMSEPMVMSDVSYNIVDSFCLFSFRDLLTNFTLVANFDELYQRLGIPREECIAAWF
jgi:hypothetical protein